MTPASDSAQRRAWLSPARFVVALVLVSAVLRIVLVARGGQLYLGDEGRYYRGVQLYQALTSGEFTKAREIAMLPEHMLFTWLGSAVTAAQHLLAQLTPYGEWSGKPAHIDFTLWLGAAVLSLFSALNIALVWQLARRAGGTDVEAAWAALLMAASNVAFYYARHLVPYDCALSFALLGLVCGVGRSSPLSAFGCGALGGLCYGIYNGYWFLVPVVWLTHAVSVRREVQRWRLWIMCGAGTAVALALPLLYGSWAGGSYFWKIMVDFSGSVRQGSFNEGWSLPWEFLWQAEGWLGVAVLAAIGVAAVRHRSQGQRLPSSVTWPAIALLACYGSLLLCSNVLRVFVVYGRSVKPLVPFLCVVGGWAIARLVDRRRAGPCAAASLILAAGAWHFWPHFVRVFPREAEIAVLRNYGNPKHTLSVRGSLYIPLDLPVTRPDLALANAQLLYPALGYIGFPPGKTLLLWPHPLSYPPFQYEGHAPRERAVLRSHDISMRLIALAEPAAVPDDLPPHLRAQPPPEKK